jgi:PPM family protein phosphatase
MTTTVTQYTIQAGTGQHIGDREEQQDRVALFTAPNAPGYVMAVLADGMGGMSGGALAATEVIRTAKLAFEQFSPQKGDIEALLTTIVHDADVVIKLTAISSDKKPHSTAVIVVITPEKNAFWTHVGDSRLYRFAGHSFAERTIDHSYVEQLVQQGRLKPGEQHTHRLSNVLLNALGNKASEPQVTVRRYDGLKAGDAFLLCSDGLWHYFTEAELATVVAGYSPRQAAEILIHNTRERAAGTSADNCTLAIIKLVAPSQEAKS